MDPKVHALAVEVYSHPSWEGSTAQVKALNFLEVLKEWETDNPGMHYRIGYVFPDEVVWWEYPHEDLARRVAITADTIEIMEYLNGQKISTARKAF